MAKFDEKALRANIRSGDFCRLYLFIGDEMYLKKLYSEQIVKKCIAPSFESFNYDLYDGEKVGLSDIIDRAMTMPMMSEKRCIVADNLKLDSLGEKEIKLFESAAENIPDSTVLIFRQKDAALTKKSGKKIAEIIDKYGAVCEIKKRRGAELLKPLMASAQKQGHELTQSMASYLVKEVGDDFNVLINELSKICAFARDVEIKKSDIDAVAVKTVDAKVYQLTKALTAGDFSKAYSILDALFELKTAPEYILGAIIGTYTDMYRVKVCSACAVSTAKLKEVFSYKGREFVLDNAQRDSRSLDMPKIRKCLDVLFTADMKLKTSRDNPVVIIEQTMVRLMLAANGERI